MHLIAIKKITCLPDICKAWTIMSPPTYSMYTSTIFREGNDPNGALLLTDWERKHCPWWIDMKKGECLEEEKEMYLRHLKGECKSRLWLIRGDDSRAKKEDGGRVKSSQRQRGAREGCSRKESWSSTIKQGRGAHQR